MSLGIEGLNRRVREVICKKMKRLLLLAAFSFPAMDEKWPGRFVGTREGEEQQFFYEIYME